MKLNKWTSKFNGGKRNNYEVSNFKKTTIQDMIQEEHENLKVNDIIFLKNKENESLILLEIEDSYLKYKMEIEKRERNRTIKYSFMYSKDRRIYTFFL